MGTSLNVHLKKLDAHLQKRVAELRKAKEGGVKVVGYFPGSFVPEELIYASGAVPLCLADGGDSSLVEASLSVMPRRFCSFVRAQIGAIIEKNNPYFDLLDLLITPISCQHMKKLGEMIEYRHDVNIVKLVLPHSYQNKFALEYYTYQLEKLKNRLHNLPVM
jgi:benzoyl-CoA reductase/2-hydroxyglutaryl-CoA dehydratase subunit BcrC/BadD/HgdB